MVRKQASKIANHKQNENDTQQTLKGVLSLTTSVTTLAIGLIDRPLVPLPEPEQLSICSAYYSVRAPSIIHSLLFPAGRPLC